MAPAIASQQRMHPDSENEISWFDSDTIILNPNIPWELFLPPSEFADVHMISTYDWNGFNCGIFFVRVNEWSVNFFTETSALPLSSPDVDLGYNKDQTAMRLILDKPMYRQHFLYQPISWYNGFHDSEGRLPHVVPGDLLVHFAGMKWRGKGRLEAGIQLWLDRIDREPATWAQELDNTTLSSDIAAFWSRTGEARQISQQASSIIEAHNATTYNTTGMRKPDLVTKMTNLEDSFAMLQLVLTEEPYKSSKMQGAIQNTTAALKDVKFLTTEGARKPETEASTDLIK